MPRTVLPLLLVLCLYTRVPAQSTPPAADARLYDIADAPSVERLEADITKLVSFGTRHTLSDTTSATRGIGAARRWIFAEFERISKACGGCLEVFYQRNLVPAGESRRIPEPTWVVNVIAIQRGTADPDRMIMMSGDIDSRISDPLNGTDESPGANDNASGMAGVLEAARVLTKYKFSGSIVYAGLSGEEQGLFGGKGLAAYAKEQGWNLMGVLNNDMIGNITGVDGVTDNQSFRIFSEPYYPESANDERQNIYRRFFGGEVDGPSRQLARYVHKQTEQYTTNLKPMLIYRLDRFGRGGHHRPFNDAGFPGIRIMETHENYTQQHQDLRVEDGIEYGDRLKHVNFPYAAKLTGVNAISLAGLAAAPPPPP
ncbi:MAG: M28 family peptidase, partial [Bacteroidota bacterium]